MDGVSDGTRHLITEGVGKGLYHYIDAACSNCGGTKDVLVYRFIQPAGPLDQIRAQCKSCLHRRSRGEAWLEEALSFFDVFGVWGNHKLHVLEKRMRPAEPKLPMPLPPNTEAPMKLKFGDKAAAVREYKKIKALPSQGQELLASIQ